MRFALILLLLPVVAQAQEFGTPPEFVAGDAVLESRLAQDCLRDLIAADYNALVSPDAQGCIGQAAALCTTDHEPVICNDLERRYWDWRIAQSFVGLRVWTLQLMRPSARDIFLPLYKNPEAATAHLGLECDVRVNRIGRSQNPEEDMAACLMKETALIALEAEFALRDACASAPREAFADYCNGARE